MEKQIKKKIYKFCHDNIIYVLCIYEKKDGKTNKKENKQVLSLLHNYILCLYGQKSMAKQIQVNQEKILLDY